MIYQLKLLIKLIPFTYRCKLSVLGMVIVYILGIVITLVFPGEELGGLFLMMGPIWLSQLIISLTVSDMVQASPLKKALHTHLLAAATFICSVVSYLLVIILDEICRFIYPAYTDGDCAFQRLTCCGIVVLFALYVSFCYKYFVLSSIMLFVGVEAIVMFHSYIAFTPQHMANLNIPLPLATLLGFVVIFLGALMQYGITCLLYKKPLSKRAQYAGLRKQM